MAKFHLGNLQAWDCSKRGEWKEILGPAVGSSLFRSERSKEVGCVETLYLSPCFRHFWENKQLPICNYKVKKPHVGTTANLANQVLKQSALMLLSKRLLWSFSSAPGEKNSRKNAKWIWNQGYRDSILSLSTQSCLYMPDLGDYLPSLHLYGQHLLNPYLRGKISPGNTLHGSGFLELHSHEKCPIDHVIFFVFLCLKPAGSSPETQYAPPLSFFFSDMSLHKRGSWKETAAPIPAGAAVAADSDLCTCMELGGWRSGREGNILERGDSKARGQMALGVANRIRLCSPGGHGITPDLN